MPAIIFIPCLQITWVFIGNWLKKPKLWDSPPGISPAPSLSFMAPAARWGGGGSVSFSLPCHDRPLSLFPLSSFLSSAVHPSLPILGAASALLLPQLPHFSPTLFLSFLFPHPLEQELVSFLSLPKPDNSRPYQDAKNSTSNLIYPPSNTRAF